jgi:hypothetical protein
MHGSIEQLDRHSVNWRTHKPGRSSGEFRYEAIAKAEAIYKKTCGRTTDMLQELRSILKEANVSQRHLKANQPENLTGLGAVYHEVLCFDHRGGNKPIGLGSE